jgi:hypothetical protein
VPNRSNQKDFRIFDFLLHERSWQLREACVCLNARRKNSSMEMTTSTNRRFAHLTTASELAFSTCPPLASNIREAFRSSPGLVAGREEARKGLSVAPFHADIRVDRLVIQKPSDESAQPAACRETQRRFSIPKSIAGITIRNSAVAQFRRLRSFQHPAANLGEFRH